MLFCIMNDHCKILRVIRHNCYLDLGNGSHKFGNHSVKVTIWSEKHPPYRHRTAELYYEFFIAIV